MKHIGIDPGAAGAWSLMRGEQVIDVFDLPTEKIKVGKTMRNRLVPAALAQTLRRQLDIGHAYLEEVGPMPRDGAVQAFNLGRSFGLIEGVLAGLGIPYTLVRSAAWKKAMRLPAEKSAARMRACQLWPSLATEFRRVKDDGRAEACLIGLYGHKSSGTFTTAAVDAAFQGGHAAA
jgi:crossover junction endodeoxyribonuclease RuvC